MLILDIKERINRIYPHVGVWTAEAFFLINCRMDELVAGMQNLEIDAMFEYALFTQVGVQFLLDHSYDGIIEHKTEFADRVLTESVTLFNLLSAKRNQIPGDEFQVSHMLITRMRKALYRLV